MRALIWMLLAWISSTQAALPSLPARRRTTSEAPWRSASPAVALLAVKLPPSPLVIVAVSSAALLRLLTLESVQRAAYFWRKAGPVVLHYKFVQWWLKDVSSQEHRDAVYEELHSRYAQPTYELMIELQGLYVKIGQVLSSRPDFVPSQYLPYLSKVQDAIPPWSLEQIQRILNREGINVTDVVEPALGAASIGQVHRANYNGRPVAVKVMHPNAQELFAHDFQVFRWLCRIALPTWKGLLDELERRMRTEFDYRNEALSLTRARSNLQQSPFVDKAYIPEAYASTQHVLVMELLEGRKLLDVWQDRLQDVLGDKADDLVALRQQQVLGADNEKTIQALVDSLSWSQRLRLLGLRRRCRRDVELLVDIHGRQMFIDGCFNGDPHPGNCLELTDGRLGLIDYGQFRYLSDDERLGLARVIVSLAEGSDDLVRAVRHAGFRLARDGDDDTLSKFATLFFDSDIDGLRQGYATPQLYFASLMATNPLKDIPDPASACMRSCPCVPSALSPHCTVFIARVSFLFRGLGSAVGLDHMRTAERWMIPAKQAIGDATQ